MVIDGDEIATENFYLMEVREFVFIWNWKLVWTPKQRWKYSAKASRRLFITTPPRDLGRHRTNAPRDLKQVCNAQQNLRAEKRLTQDSLYNLLAETCETGLIKRLMVHGNLLMFCYEEHLVKKFKAVIDQEDLPPQFISYDTYLQTWGSLVEFFSVKWVRCEALIWNSFCRVGNECS